MTKNGRKTTAAGKKGEKPGRPSARSAATLQNKPRRPPRDYSQLAAGASLEELDELAQQCRKAYLRCWRDQTGNPQSEPPLPLEGGLKKDQVYKPKWHDLARLCWHYVVPPEEYILFWVENIGGYPTGLLSENCFKTFVRRTATEYSGQAVHEATHAELGKLMDHYFELKEVELAGGLVDEESIDEGAIWTSVLFENRPKTSAITRYLWEYEQGEAVFNRVEAMCEKTAAWSYASSPAAYEQDWEIPDRLCKLAQPLLMRRNAVVTGD